MTIPPIDHEELQRAIELNRQERRAYIQWKVRWMREQGQIIDPE